MRTIASLSPEEIQLVMRYGRCHQCGEPRRVVVRVDGRRVPAPVDYERLRRDHQQFSAGLECSAGHDLDGDLDYEYGELGERTDGLLTGRHPRVDVDTPRSPQGDAP